MTLEVLAARISIDKTLNVCDYGRFYAAVSVSFKINIFLRRDKVVMKIMVRAFHGTEHKKSVWNFQDAFGRF